MSASIMWQPKEGKYLDVGLKSRFVTALDLPCELDETAIPFLTGMAAAEPSFLRGCNDLINAIQEHKIIRVWAEY